MCGEGSLAAGHSAVCGSFAWEWEDKGRAQRRPGPRWTLRPAAKGQQTQRDPGEISMKTLWLWDGCVHPFLLVFSVVVMDVVWMYWEDNFNRGQAFEEKFIPEMSYIIWSRPIETTGKKSLHCKWLISMAISVTTTMLTATTTTTYARKILELHWITLLKYNSSILRCCQWMLIWPTYSLNIFN